MRRSGRLTSPRRTASRVSSPTGRPESAWHGLGAPGLDAHGLDAPGLDGPGLDGHAGHCNPSFDSCSAGSPGWTQARSSAISAITVVW